jgi:hypothetical protein
MKKAAIKNTATTQSNKQSQGVDKDPQDEKGRGEPVTKNDLKGKTVDRLIKEKKDK